jgi:cytochrome c-type biogenesis protein
MSSGGLTLALTAGMLAALNPCGFALLPAYLALLVNDGAPQGWRSVRRVVTATGAMTAGFVAVFGIFGLVIAPVAAWVEQYLPWVTAGLGLMLAACGVWLVLGRNVPGLGLVPRLESVRWSVRSMVGFGVSYALASLSCTIGPFLALVVFSFRDRHLIEGVALFVAYGAGMGLVVGTAALGVALAKTSVVGLLRRAGRVVPVATGVILIVVGAYVLYYGYWELRVLSGAASDGPVIRFATALQHRAVMITQSVGALGFLLAATALIVALGVAVVRSRHTGVPRTPSKKS